MANFVANPNAYIRHSPRLGCWFTALNGAPTVMLGTPALGRAMSGVLGPRAGVGITFGGGQLVANSAPSLDEVVASIDHEVASASSAAVTTVFKRPGGRRALGFHKHVVFGLAEAHYALAMANVTEIQRPPPITVIPKVPAWLLGVTNLRGEIVSVVDLRAFLGMETIPYEQSSRFIVVRSLQQEMTTSLVVDRVAGVRTLDPARLATPTAQVDDRLTPFVAGVYDSDSDLLVVLDIERLLLSPDMRRFETT